MSVTTASMYALVALATPELSEESHTTLSLTLPLKESEVSEKILQPDSLPAVAHAICADAPNVATTDARRLANASLSLTQQRFAIAPPETLDEQPFTRVAAQRQSHPEQVKAVNVSVPPPDIFTPYLNQIRSRLPSGMVMRLPSHVSKFDNSDGEDNRYIVAISPSTSKSGLTVSLFTCEAQIPSCLAGRFAVAAKTSVEAQQEFKNHQAAATPITLANNIRGYLLRESKQKLPSDFSSVMWEQDDQVYTVRISENSRLNLLKIADSMAGAIPIKSTNTEISLTNLVNEQGSKNERLNSQETEETKDLKTSATTADLLQNRHPTLTTAEQLQQGEVVTNLRYRQTFPSGTAQSVGLTGQPSFGISWGATDNLELTVDAQTVDNSGPVRQGPFNAQRINPDGTGPNFFQEFTLQAKQRLWENEEGTVALSGVAAASLGNAGRPYRFFNQTGAVSNGKNEEIIPSLELPFTIRTNNRWQFTLSPKVAFLPKDNALYFNTAPIENPGSFGTTFGLAGGVSYQLNPRLILWGDAFVPFTGNNTINRSTGLPAKAVAFNAGVRYLVNPRLATDLFVSNTLGNTGPLSMIADRDNLAVGFGVTYLPGITSANRRYAEHFRSTVQPPPDTSAGFSLLDGGTIPRQQLRLSLQGGEQGLLTGIRYGLLDDLEIGAFLESIPGTIDESMLGLSGKIRFLHQADGDPFTLSGLVTVARANNVLVNLVNNNRNELEEQGLEKGGFVFSNEKAGEVLVISLSAPMHYQFKGGSAVWLTPTLGFVQRSGLEVAGLNLGGSVPLTKDLEVIAEAGLELTGNGNAFMGNKRETVIPWTVGLRWRPASLLGISETSAISGLQLEAYVTNRVGTTPFGSLRVRADNDMAIGVGLVLPIQF